MRRLTLPLFALLSVLVRPGTVAAAEQLDPTFRITSSGLVNFTAIALLPLPGDRLVEVFAWPNQPDVCADITCIGLRFRTSNATQIGTTRIKTAGLNSVTAATVDSRGRIVVVGTAQAPGADGVDFAIVRFNTDGSDDTSLAGDGGTSIGFNLGQANNDVPVAVAVDRYDNIVVAGWTQRTDPGDTDFAIAKLRAVDGAPDSNFGASGKSVVFFDLGPTSRLDQAQGVVVRNDGKIVLGGFALDSAISRYRAVLAQLNADGSLDANFCSPTCTLNAGFDAINSGRRVYYFGALSAHTDVIYGIDVAANNDIAVVGRTASDDGSTQQAAYARFSGTGVAQVERLEPGIAGTTTFRDVRFADAGTRVIAAGTTGANSSRFFVQTFGAFDLFEPDYGSCLTGNSALCFIGSPTADDGVNRAGQLHLDARGRPLFIGTYFTGGDVRGRTLSQRITNTSGPPPDRIFRNGYQ